MSKETRSLLLSLVPESTLDQAFPGGNRSRVTPVPIPNTEVKPATADGTVWATAWESRSLPGVFVEKKPDAVE